MKYNFRKLVEDLLEERHRTKKSLYEYLKMTGQGFDAMLKNNTVSAVRLAEIAEFLQVPVSHFFGIGNEGQKNVIQDSFGEEVVKKMADDIGELRHFFEEEIKVKNQQIAGLQRTVDVLVGKSEGTIPMPISTGDRLFDENYRLYVSAVSEQHGIVKSPIIPSVVETVVPYSPTWGIRQ